MHGKATELFQLLVQAGAVPGRDFSCDPDQQGYRLNQRSVDLLTEAYPEIDWDELLFPCTTDVTNLAETLHQALGVPFVDNLLIHIKARIQQLPDHQASWYLTQILVGVEQRTGLDLLVLMAEHFSLSTMARIEWLLRLKQSQPCDDWLRDLVQSAGGAETDVAWDDHGLYLTERGLNLLERVWIGDCEAVPESPRRR
jgi:hypothetical protein